MKLKNRKLCFFITLFLVAIVFTSGCLDLLDRDSGNNEKRIPYSRASGSRITLINNDNARDPSWDELVSFLEADKTETVLYDTNSFVCGDYAEMLHNNAEASGIKAGWAALNFEEWDPHALNVFYTTDRGLVYIDCTRSNVSINDEEDILLCNQDKVAYLVPGKIYGTISIDKVTSLQYGFYDEYRLNWELLNAEYNAHSKAVSEHNREVEVYNETVERHHKDIEAYEDAVGGRAVIPDPNEYAWLKDKQQRIIKQGEELYAMQLKINANKAVLDEWVSGLDAKRNKVGCYWKPFGVVKSVNVYW